MELDPVYCINCKKAIAGNVLICPSCGQNQRERPQRLTETAAGAGAGARGGEESAVAAAQLTAMGQRSRHDAYGDDRGVMGELMNSWIGRRVVMVVIAATIGVIGRATGCLPSRTGARDTKAPLPRSTRYDIKDPE